jgi:hypothetical protein
MVTIKQQEGVSLIACGRLDLLEGEYKNPVRVVGFNTAEKWSQDVSADVTHELRRRLEILHAVGDRSFHTA